MTLNLTRPYDAALAVVQHHFGTALDDSELVDAVAKAIAEPWREAQRLENELYWLNLRLGQLPSPEHFDAVIWIAAELKGLLDTENPTIDEARAIMAKGIEQIDALPRRRNVPA